MHSKATWQPPVQFKKRHKKDESRLQSACVRVYRMCVPARHRDALFAIPNGAHVSEGYRYRLLSEGMIAGWPDLGLCIPDGKILWFELKTKTGYISPHQKMVHEMLHALGHKVIIIRDVQHFKDELTINAKDMMHYGS